MKKIVKFIGATLSIVLPVLAFLVFADIHDVYLYNWLWCGFYGCIIVCFLFKSKLYKIIVVALNLCIALFCAFGALMGGVYGLMIVVLHIFIPFYSSIFQLF